MKGGLYGILLTPLNGLPYLVVESKATNVVGHANVVREIRVDAKPSATEPLLAARKHIRCSAVLLLDRNWSKMNK